MAGLTAKIHTSALPRTHSSAKTPRTIHTQRLDFLGCWVEPGTGEALYSSGGFMMFDITFLLLCSTCFLHLCPSFLQKRRYKNVFSNRPVVAPLSLQVQDATESDSQGSGHK